MVLGEPNGKSTLEAEETATPAGWKMSQRLSSKAPRPVYMATASAPDSSRMVSSRRTMRS